MKKSNILIAIGAILWIIFAALNTQGGFLADLGLGYVPLLIIAAGIIAGLCSKKYRRPQVVFAVLYFVLLAVQLALVVMYKTGAIYAMGLLAGYAAMTCFWFPSMLVFLPLGGLVLSSKGRWSKVFGILILVSWALHFLKAVSIIGMTVPHIYKFTKHITTASTFNIPYSMFMCLMSIAAGIALLIWAVSGVRKERGSKEG